MTNMGMLLIQKEEVIHNLSQSFIYNFIHYLHFRILVTTTPNAKPRKHFFAHQPIA